MSIFKPFAILGKAVWRAIKFPLSKSGREEIAGILEKAQSLLEPALAACQKIAELTPTRADDEILALVRTYGLGRVTPEMIRNDAILSGILKAAAMKELNRHLKEPIPDRVLDLAIQGAFIIFKQAKAEGAVA